MEEIILNLHMHTTYSDGTGSHKDIAQAALRAGLDVVIVTDHNVLVSDKEGYHCDGKKRLLMLIGEEIHDQARQPQKNHLLVFNAGRELATYAPDSQTLIDQVRRAGGLSFIAHPTDKNCPAIGEASIDWVDWQAQGFTGLELWNSLSELKSVSPTYLHAAFHVFFPHRIARGPEADTITRWDSLHSQGKRVVAIGGSDAHALKVHAGPLTRLVFPYEWHFRGINNHILSPQPLNGDLEHDRKLVYDALAAGHSFIGYDLPAPTRGFRFHAKGREQEYQMGDETDAKQGITLQVHSPLAAEIHLLKDGRPLKVWENRQAGLHNTNEPGVYRVEVYIHKWGRRRAWVISNPIYLR